MNGTKIRPARPEDAEALLKIYSYYVLNTAVSYEYDAPSLEEFRGRIENTLKKYPYLLAEREGGNHRLRLCRSSLAEKGRLMGGGGIHLCGQGLPPRRCGKAFVLRA